MKPETETRPLWSLAAFFVIACAWSWLNWGLIIASGRGWLPFRFPLNPWGSFGPAVAAVVVSAARAGRRGVRELFTPILRWRFGFGRWGVVVLGPVGLVAASAGLYAAAGGQVLPVGPVDVARTILLAVVLLVVGGPVGEEVGWRGFALPRLLERTGPVGASLVVAGMWVYLTTSASLLAAIVFHHSVNVSAYFLPSVLPALESARGFDRIFLVVTWAAAGSAVIAMLRQARTSAARGDQAV